MKDSTVVMTVEEFSARMRIGRRLAYEAIKRGEVPGVIHIGRTIRISVAAWEEWMGGQANDNDRGDDG